MNTPSPPPWMAIALRAAEYRATQDRADLHEASGRQGDAQRALQGGQAAVASLQASWQAHLSQPRLDPLLATHYARYAQHLAGAEASLAAAAADAQARLAGAEDVLRHSLGWRDALARVVEAKQAGASLSSSRQRMRLDNETWAARWAQPGRVTKGQR